MRSLRLRALMEEQHRHEISQRMRQLRDDSPETNRSIADAVDVGERTVAGWLSPENPTGISYANARKVAEMFSVDVDWLWRGTERGPTPDPFASDGAQLDRMDEKLDQILTLLRALDLEQLGADLDRLLDQDGRPPEEEQRGAGGH